MRTFNVLACGVVLAASTVVHAQQVVQEVQTAPVNSPGNPTEIRRVSQILGSTVRLQGNNNFGTVDDIVLNNNGGIEYLVVSNGGRYVMAPWNAANMNYGQRFVSYNVAPQALKPLYFERTAWPNVYDPAYATRIRQIFPANPARREVLRPVPAGAPVPAPGVVNEKVKVKPNGTVKVKERIP